MIIAVYVMALVGGLYNTIIFQVLMVIPFIFILVYAVSYKYYNSKM